MSEKIFIPLGIKDMFIFENAENNNQNNKIYEELLRELKINEELKTDYNEKESKVKQYNFYFRAGETNSKEQNEF